MMIRRQASPKKNALTTALDSLSRRHMSAFQLISKLEMKGYSSEEISEAINKLNDWRYIDDQEYAVSYIKSKGTKYSRARIVGELHKAGIDNDIINKALADGYSEQKEFENGLMIGRKIYTSESKKVLRRVSESAAEWEENNPVAGISQDVILRKKIGDRLLSKGYRLETVKKILYAILQE